MTVSEFITAITVVGLIITLLVAFFAWAFVKLFLLRWERTQSETIASQESESVNEKKIFIKEYPLTQSEAFKQDELLEPENVDYSEVKYFGIPVTQIPRKELYKILYNQALSYKKEIDRRFELEQQLTALEFNNK